MQITLVKAGNGYSKEYKASYNRYRVLINGTPIEDKYEAKKLKELPYWSNRSQTMAMTCWGTSQEFEAILALGRYFRLADEKQMEWGDYVRKVKEYIRVV